MPHATARTGRRQRRNQSPVAACAVLRPNVPMDDSDDSLEDKGSGWDAERVPLGAPLRPARATLRDAVVRLIGETATRSFWPKYPKRPANFFTTNGKPHYHGHRERLRQRFLRTWPEGLPDYELLELLLFNAIPYVDVKPLAKKLLETFGSLNAVVSAPNDRLLAVPGVDRWVLLQLRLVDAMAIRLARSTLADRCALGSYSSVVAYCRTTMAWRDVEHVRALYLDNANALIEDVKLGEGTPTQVMVYPREVARRGLSLNATSLILVHNHPGGDPTPSDADIDMTRRIRSACDTVGIRLLDHIIIGRGAETSMHAHGLLR